MRELYLGNLTPDIDKEALEANMKIHGNIEDIDMFDKVKKIKIIEFLNIF